MPMTEQGTNNRQSHSGANPDAGMGMPQVMDPDALELGMISDQVPGPLEIGARLVFAIAGNDEVPDAGQID